ncbi:hypothetical protein [Sphaerisporangium aureirubrum]|uniref:SbsA Ig-like domain-containing protein n=1 Tax=Sphaerisporangium aureirubrum TaxID=1544736 RepID=A0ABW1NDC3_9ACTN
MPQPITRAKCRCQSIEMFAGADQRKIRFTPEYDASVPEDQRYARYTPSGELWLMVTNPAVDFRPGQSYYLDFTPVEETSDGPAD